MPTPADLKALIDAQITDKTLPYSISNVDVGDRLKDIVDLVGTAGCLVFNNTVERNAYLGSGNGAIGQFGFDKQDRNLYFIGATGIDWCFIASSDGPSEPIFFVNQTSV